jgi:hypothetical protein
MGRRLYDISEQQFDALLAGKAARSSSLHASSMRS